MPLTLKNLKNDTATATLDYAGETIHLTYKPSAFTPAFMAELAELGEAKVSRESMEQAIAMLLGALVGWDVLDEEGGSPVPITHEFLADLEFPLLLSMLGAISNAAMLPKRNGTGKSAA
jgi:hypothetical protein